MQSNVESKSCIMLIRRLWGEVNSTFFSIVNDVNKRWYPIKTSFRFPKRSRAFSETSAGWVNYLASWIKKLARHCGNLNIWYGILHRVIKIVLSSTVKWKPAEEEYAIMWSGKIAATSTPSSNLSGVAMIKVGFWVIFKWNHFAALSKW